LTPSIDARTVRTESQALRFFSPQRAKERNPEVQNRLEASALT
jgi:hypothetical protein